MLSASNPIPSSTASARARAGDGSPAPGGDRREPLEVSSTPSGSGRSIDRGASRIARFLGLGYRQAWVQVQAPPNLEGIFIQAAHRSDSLYSPRAPID